MLGYQPKSEEQKAWDLVKAAVTARVNLEVAAYRIRRRDELLGSLWPEFSAALNGEEILSIDPEFSTWIGDAIEAISETSTVR